ncbi:hypothetical protein [Novosphingobium album (ex Liu et al. 2023)]|uniref:Uncharacterized protein n=1 Tax=Novosphingobium album (ex Liu et al. 2023) TaxID=3031130 RepID=A0ABT5WJJ5_9SPHN|nr:hypothetical protein [Novosphingobium album (ex Liu et al. 2023)]MDE8650211.1 hypothetical protein [Novosphingobium album (ex Liu et al. 2023)]
MLKKLNNWLLAAEASYLSQSATHQPTPRKTTHKAMDSGKALISPIRNGEAQSSVASDVSGSRSASGLRHGVGLFAPTESALSYRVSNLSSL